MRNVSNYVLLFALLSNKSSISSHYYSKNGASLPNAALIQGRLLLETIWPEVRLLFEGGSYLRAALNNDFTVYNTFTVIEIQKRRNLKRKRSNCSPRF